MARKSSKKILAAIIIMAAVFACRGTLQGAERPHTIVVTDYPDIHAAVAAARKLGVGRIYVPAGVYYLDRTLDLTGLSYNPIRKTETGEDTFVAKSDPVIFEGAGQRTVLVARTDDKPAIDLTGSHPFMILRDFVLNTPYDEKKREWQKGANVGILLARMGEAGKPEDPPTGNPASSGNHSFYNIKIRGGFSVACVYSWNSEVNSFFHCQFSNAIGDGFIYTGVLPMNREGVRSAYRRMGASTNVHTCFYQCQFDGGPDSSGLRISQGGDVSLIGGYMSHCGFASLYLDGSNCVKNVSVRDVRFESSRSRHCIYAVGAVRDIILDGGDWFCSEEVIKHVERVPNTDGPHKYVHMPQQSGRAFNWQIRGIRMGRSFEEDPALTIEKQEALKEDYALMRFDALQDSCIENINYYMRGHKPGEAQFSGGVVTDRPAIIIEKYARRNTFVVPSREAVLFRGDTRNNEIIALAEGAGGEKVPALWRSSLAEIPGRPGFTRYYDDGIRRTYINADGGSLLNLGVQNVFEIPGAKAGDVALHDGSGFKDRMPRLAIYSGEKWIFFSIERQTPSGR